MFSQWDQLGQKLQEKDGPEEEEDFDDLAGSGRQCHQLLRNLSSVPELQVRAGQYSSIFCGFSNRFNLLIGYLLAFYSRDSPKIIFVFCERRGKELNVPYYI